MGQQVSAKGLSVDVVADQILTYLTPTQARAAMCAVQVGEASAATVYWTFATRNCQSEKLKTHHEARMAYKAAASRGPRAAYWAAQSKICELCRYRPSCVRRTCFRCNRNRSRYNVPEAGVDVCCQCAEPFLPMASAEERKQKMVLAAEAWSRHSCSLGLPPHLLPCLRDLGGDFGGRLFLAKSFGEAEALFQEQSAAAREHLLSKAGLVSVAAATLRKEILQKCLNAGLFAETAPPNSSDKFAALCWDLVSAARRAAREAEAVDDDDAPLLGSPDHPFRVASVPAFLAQTVKVIDLLRRAGTLLLKVDRIGLPRAQKAVFNTRRVLNRVFQLDAASLILCGVAVSAPGAHVPTKLLNQTKKNILQTIGFAAFHACEVAAKRVAGGHEQTTPFLAATTSMAGGAPQGLSFAELWVGQPQYCKRLRRQLRSSSEVPSCFPMFVSEVEERDPDHESRTQALWASVNKGLDDDGSDAEDVPPRPKTRLRPLRLLKERKLYTLLTEEEKAFNKKTRAEERRKAKLKKTHTRGSRSEFGTKKKKKRNAKGAAQVTIGANLL